MSDFLEIKNNIPKRIYIERAEQKEILYTLIFEGNMNKKEVWSMTEEEVYEANEALNLHIERINKKRKGK